MTARERPAVAIPVFPEFTALDAVGPYEVLQRIPTLDVTFVGHRRGEVRSDNGMLGLQADAVFEELPAPDVVVFPGGAGTRPLERDERVLSWLRLDDRIITAAGVSAGIDMALRLAEQLVDRTAGEAAQLMIEYDPQPPFDRGSVDKADDAVMTRVIEYAAVRE